MVILLFGKELKRTQKNSRRKNLRICGTTEGANEYYIWKSLK